MNHKDLIYVLLILIINLSVSFTSAQTVLNDCSKLNYSLNNNSSFTENKGQVFDQYHHPRNDILFYGNINGLVFHLRDSGVSYQLYRPDSIFDESISNHLADDCRSDINLKSKDLQVRNKIYRTDVSWLGANENVKIEKGLAGQGYCNYYLDVCPSGILGVKSYDNVIYRELYPGIDLKWYVKNGNLEYDFIVSPNADLHEIKWRIDGYEKIFINGSGQLVIQTPLGEIRKDAPVAYQNEIKLEVSWSLENNVVGIDINNYNTLLSLIIDPVVRAWGTYYGGTLSDAAESSSIDQYSNIYVAGNTSSISNIATIESHQITHGGNYDAFLVKFNSSGVRQWATYYGGSNNDLAWSCTVDNSSHVYLAGTTSSNTVIATAGSHQPVSGGLNDAYIVKFNSTTGVRQWATYYGGTSIEEGLGCAVDQSNNVYLCGMTKSFNSITTSSGHKTTLDSNQNSDAFLVKFNSSGVRQWATYYGGSMGEVGFSCVADSASNIYMVGETGSDSSIASSGSHQIVKGGPFDAFLVKFNNVGVRQWATYYGGSKGERGKSCSIDDSMNVYIAGWTNSNSSIASSGSHQTILGGSDDAFLVKFNTNGLRQWATYYGGSGIDLGYGCNTDKYNNVYLAGSTGSVSQIATLGSHQGTFGGGYDDAFFVKFKSSGTRQWGSYYGSSGSERGSSISIDEFSNVCLTGGADSSNSVATAGSHQFSYGGGFLDGFVAKFAEDNVGVVSIETDDHFKLYPNPTTGQITIELTNPSSGTIEIYNSIGSKVYEEVFNAESMLDISLGAAFENGVYLIKLITEDSISSQKLILQRE